MVRETLPKQSFGSLPDESEFFCGKIMIIKYIPPETIYFKECKLCKKLRAESSFNETDECIVCREGLHTGEFYF